MNDIVKSPRGSSSSLLENNAISNTLHEQNMLVLKLKESEKKCSDLEAEYAGKQSFSAAVYFY
jgi:hypothetical protein